MVLLEHTAKTPRLLPGAEVIARIRRVLVVALVATFAYSTFSSASRVYCPGGVDGDGGFIDSAGNPTDQAPMCINMALRPSPLVFLGIALIVLFALGRVLKAADEVTAIRTLDRAATGLVILALGALVISQVWFTLIPVTDFQSSSFRVFGPFPFGSIDVDITPSRTH